MKKNLVRIVALLLVAMLALTLIPMGAMAAMVIVDGLGTDEASPKPTDMNVFLYQDYEYGAGSVTIKTSDYDKYLVAGNQDYDLIGVVDGGKALTKPNTNLDPQSSVTFKDHLGWAWLIYTPHQHKLDCWISDGTTHWRHCKVCKDQFVYQNWCQDGDEDGICNVCGGDVPYHDVTVIDSEGGKITVNKETASHRTKITADVEAADGYKLKELHFTKIRDDGSEQEITRYKKNGQFWTRMPTYELEVSAEFVKK